MHLATGDLRHIVFLSVGAVDSAVVHEVEARFRFLMEIPCNLIFQSLFRGKSADIRRVGIMALFISVWLERLWRDPAEGFVDATRQLADE